MYESFYGFRINPFSLVPDPKFLFLGAQHKTALNLLEYGLFNRAIFTVITGEPGTGKTTLLNAILERSQHEVTLGVLSHTHRGLGSMMPWVLMAFGLESKGLDSVELFKTFTAFIAREHERQRRIVLVVDEAQNLGSAMLEELRLLSNVNDGRRQPLQIILSGQPALRGLLQRDELIQFAQRISVEYALEPLAEDETIAYIDHRVRVAGGRKTLFSTLSRRTVFSLTGGLPRLINQLCDYALVYGYAAQADMITASVVLDVARSRDRNGFLPFRVDPASIEPSQNEYDEETAEASTVHSATSSLDTLSTTTRPARADADPAISYREALALKQTGEYARAAVLFDRLVTDADWSVKALAQKGLCFKAIGRYDEALASFRAALKRPSGSAQDLESLRYLFARTLEAMGRSKEAVESYRAISRDSRNYRDVAARIDQLQSEATICTETWLQSLVRSCSHLLRSTS